MSSDRARLGSGTDGGTLDELETLVLARARVTGEPAFTVGFSSSGRHRVFDVKGDPDVDELELEPLGTVPIEPSRPLGKPAKPTSPPPDAAV